MGINRLYTPAEIPTVQPFALPYQEIAQGLMAAQQQQDAASQLVGDIEDTQFNYITEHDPLAQSIMADIRGSVDDLVSRSADGDLRHLTSDIKKLARQTGRRFAPDGDIGKLQRVYAAKQAWLERQRQNDKIDPDFLTGAMRTFSGNTVADFSDPNFDLYSSAPEIVDAFDYNEWANTYAKDIEAKVIETARGIATSEDGHLLPFITNIQEASEYLGEDRIKQVLYDFANSNRAMHQYMRQGMQFGVFDEGSAFGMLDSAVNAAANKYKVENYKSGFSLSTNGLFNKMLELDQTNFGVSKGQNMQNALNRSNDNLYRGTTFDANGNVVPDLLDASDNAPYADKWNLEGNDPAWMGNSGGQNPLFLNMDFQESNRVRTERAAKLKQHFDDIRANNPGMANFNDQQISNAINNGIVNTLGAYSSYMAHPLQDGDDADKYFKQASQIIADGGDFINRDVAIVETDGRSTTSNVEATLKQAGILNKNGKLRDKYKTTNIQNAQDWMRENLIVNGLELADPQYAGFYRATIPDQNGIGTPLLISGTETTMNGFQSIRDIGGILQNSDKVMKMIGGGQEYVNVYDPQSRTSTRVSVSIQSQIVNGEAYFTPVLQEVDSDGNQVGNPFRFESLVDGIANDVMGSQTGTGKQKQRFSQYFNMNF